MKLNNKMFILYMEDCKKNPHKMVNSVIGFHESLSPKESEQYYNRAISLLKRKKIEKIKNGLHSN
jgi:hypothetical protein